MNSTILKMLDSACSKRHCKRAGRIRLAEGAIRRHVLSKMADYAAQIRPTSWARQYLAEPVSAVTAIEFFCDVNLGSQLPYRQSISKVRSNCSSQRFTHNRTLRRQNISIPWGTQTQCAQ